MKAIIVEFSLTTRIIVPDDFNIDNLRDEDYDTIRERAVPRFHEKLNQEGVGDLIASIEEDEEIPFGSSIEDEYYQPSFDDLSKVEGLSSFEVFASKEIAQKAFPGVEILTFHGGDIEEPSFVDERYK
jgi:hypothetical protein